MIARIIMSEHPDEKDLKLFASDHKDAVKDGFLANRTIIQNLTG